VVGPYTCSITAQTLDASDITGTLASATLPLVRASARGKAKIEGTSITRHGTPSWLS
jgi:hypothetical protein